MARALGTLFTTSATLVFSLIAIASSVPSKAKVSKSDWV
jgi:hypothetical protein